MLTRTLAEFVIDTRTEDLPVDVLTRARAAPIDTLGVGLAGSIGTTRKAEAEAEEHP